jgi:hypothetical protein
MSFNNYYNYQFSFLEKREKMSYYVKLSLGLHELPTSERLNHNKRQKKKRKKKKGHLDFCFEKFHFC